MSVISALEKHRQMKSQGRLGLSSKGYVSKPKDQAGVGSVDKVFTVQAGGPENRSPEPA